MSVPDFLRELIRFQALMFISHSSPTAPATPRELSKWLRVPTETCEEVIGELAEDGFVDPLPEIRFASGHDLHLTPIGAGWLRWVSERIQDHDE